MELEAQPVDLTACIKDAVDLMAGMAAEKGIELSYSLEEGVPRRILGDITRLRQVLVNLLSNAVKFTERGSVAVLVSGKALEGDGDRFEVHFAVRDTGIGIPAERLDRLFKSFSQVDSSITRKYGGTGLGLAISRRLVEMMGGRIWVESTLQKGSTFHFTIPARPTDKETIRSKAASMLPPAPTSRSSPAWQRPGEERKLRILLAEDNDVNQKVALHMLKRLGYQADVAANGLEVLQALESRSYDVILMDIQMPEMDGIEAARRIHERWPRRGPKIIAITAYALEGDRERLLSAGMDEYISKPIQMEELRSVLEACN